MPSTTLPAPRPSAQVLTPGQFQGLADVPPEIEWFANLTNANTRRAYQQDIEDFMAFAGLRHPPEFRNMLSLSHEHLTSCDLEAFVVHAEALRQHHLEARPTPFPKAPSRGLSPDPCTPRPIALTRAGEVEGGLRWLVGATIDCSCTRSLCAPHYGARGGPCYDPASLVV